MLLPNGKATVSRVEAVIFDAMYTVIEPKIPRFYLIKKVFEAVLGIEIAPAQLARYLRESKMAIPAEADYKREWITRNRYIAARLLGKDLSEVSEKDGQKIHLWIIKGVRDVKDGDVGIQSTPEDVLYEVKPAMRNLLCLLNNLRILPHERLREAVPVASQDDASIQVKIEIYEPPKLILASNQYRAYLEAMARDLQLEEFFGPRVISSDQLGCAKPDPQFYEKVLNWCSLESGQAVVVGNSVTRDLPPALAAGLPLCLYDRRGKLTLPPEVDKQAATVVRTIAEMQDWLLSRLISGWVQKEEEPIEPLIA